MTILAGNGLAHEIGAWPGLGQAHLGSSVWVSGRPATRPGTNQLWHQHSALHCERGMHLEHSCR